MSFSRVKICTTVPHENADALREALGNAGAGAIGEYRFCSFTVTGKGRFLPTARAHPHIGMPGELEVVEEEQIEVICERTIAPKVVAALRTAHPYEEPIVDIIPLIDEKEL